MCCVVILTVSLRQVHMVLESQRDMFSAPSFGAEDKGVTTLIANPWEPVLTFGQGSHQSSIFLSHPHKGIRFCSNSSGTIVAISVDLDPLSAFCTSL